MECERRRSQGILDLDMNSWLMETPSSEIGKATGGADMEGKLKYLGLDVANFRCPSDI